MPDDKKPNPLLLNIDYHNPVDVNEVALVVNVLVAALDGHTELLDKMTKAMSQMTDMVEKHNKALIELRKKVMPFEEEPTLQ